MTVQDPTVVDVVASEPSLNQFMLVMIEDRPWTGERSRMAEIQAKVNAYLSFVLDGQITRLYPDSSGAQIVFRLDCQGEPDPATAQFLERLRTAVAAHGVLLAVRPRPTDS